MTSLIFAILLSAADQAPCGVWTRDTVDLRSCWVTDADLPALAKRPGLKRLDLSMTRITDQGLLQLKSMTGLEELNLRYAELITDEGMSAVKGWKQLRRIDVRGTKWRIVVELSADPKLGEWVDISDSVVADKDLDAEVRCIGVRLAIAHPFTERFVGSDGTLIEPLLRIAAALVLAETVARSGGAKKASLVRRHFNELLRTALAEP